MNKKTRFIFDALVIVALAGMYALYFLRDQERLVYVDSAKLLNGYQAMVDARKDYQRKANSWKANVDTLTSEVQDAIKKYERDLAGMSARERALSEELLKSKQRQLMDYQRAMQEKAQQEDQKMSQDVITQANSFLERYGKRHNYRIIFAATQAGNIVYAQDGLDITQEVLEELNQEYGRSKK